MRIMLAQQAVDAIRWALGIGEIGGGGSGGGGDGGSRGDYQSQQ